MTSTINLDVCIHDPGKKLDVHFTSELRIMGEVRMGEVSYRKTIAEDRLKPAGHKALTSRLKNWLTPIMFVDISSAKTITDRI